MDFKNAFNERRRNQVLASLYAEQKLEPIWKLAEWAYSTPSPLWIRSTEGEMIQPQVLVSTSGVKQGDPLGSIYLHYPLNPCTMRQYNQIQQEQ